MKSLPLACNPVYIGSSTCRLTGITAIVLRTITFLIFSLSLMTLSAAELVLTWQAPIEQIDGSFAADVAGYRLYYGTVSMGYSSMIDAGLATTATLTNLQEGLTYYFAVTAYNSSGIEGDFSAELVWTPPSATILDHFTWGTIAPQQTSGVPIQTSITALDASNLIASSFNSSASLSALSSNSVSLNAGTGNSIYPMATSSDDARTQVIFLSNEIAQSGWIKALAVNVKTMPSQMLNKWTLRLKNTALGGYTTKSAWESSGWSTVYQSPITVNSTGWMVFLFSSPYYYDGLSNLMVDFSFNNTNHSRDGYCRYTSVSSKRTLYYKANGSYGDPLTWAGTSPRPNLSASIPNVLFQFSKPIVITPTQTANFVNGRWTGSISVMAPVQGVSLTAVDNSAHQGMSSVFNVNSNSNPSIQSAVIESPVPSSLPFVDDFDDDGMADSDELVAGTDPYDPDSILKMIGLSPSADLKGKGYDVQWASVTGKSYTVMRSTNLTSPSSFAPIGTNTPGREIITSYTDLNATNPGASFYKVQIAP